MTTRFISSGLWPEITRAVKKQPTRCFVAVAFFGEGGAKRMPLKQGSTLVVDLSLNTLSRGLTCPNELKPLIRAGVKVFPAENLHAKVFVVGQSAFVGSSNVSSRSERTLTEAAMFVTDKPAVSACRDFVRELCSENALTLAAIGQYQKQYVRPKVPAGSRKGSKREAVKTGKSQLWYARVTDADGTDSYYAAEKKSKAAAKSRAESSDSDIESMAWATDYLSTRAKFKDYVVVDWKRSSGRRFLYPRARILDVRPYFDKEGSSNEVIITYELPAGTRGRPFKSSVKLLGIKPRTYDGGQSGKLLRGETARRIHETFTPEASQRLRKR